MKRKIKLNDGTTVELKSNISIAALRKFQSKGLLPASLLEVFVNADKDPEKLEPYLMNATWIAFINANPDTKMSQTDFESKLDLNFELMGDVLSEMIGGVSRADGKLANGFRRATKKGKKKGLPKSVSQK